MEKRLKRVDRSFIDGTISLHEDVASDEVDLEIKVKKSRGIDPSPASHILATLPIQPMLPTIEQQQSSHTEITHLQSELPKVPPVVENEEDDDVIDMTQLAHSMEAKKLLKKEKKKRKKEKKMAKKKLLKEKKKQKKQQSLGPSTSASISPQLHIWANDRCGTKVLVECAANATIGHLKSLIAEKIGRSALKIRLQKSSMVFNDHVSLEDYDLIDGMSLELYYN